MVQNIDVIRRVCKKFGRTGEIIDVQEIKIGNINKTYLVIFSDTEKYILQQVNTYVFKHPDEIMANISAVTAHLKNKYAVAGKSHYRRVMDFITTDKGEYGIQLEDSSFWRLCIYVDRSVSYNTVSDLSLLRKSGAAFGEFEALLADFDADSLYETIPGFHNTAKRYENFLKSVENDAAWRRASVQEEIDFVIERAELAKKLTTLHEEGVLPNRVTHNDTKYNNILIDIDTNEPLCVVDLDTVMPGLVAYDFGDAIRFAANTTIEDDPDTSKVSLDLACFEAFADGYLSRLKGFLTNDEIIHMTTGALTMTYELVIRFLTDYLDGDKYFKIKSPTHNLERTRNQIALLKDMERKEAQMIAITERYLSK
ncbi:MAG: aminoglycoside phosphotransferase family protein [Clostridiales bacterium]|nr:aminoglycoside phosphotransferase family protein [Clostridiales bacterium]